MLLRPGNGGVLSLVRRSVVLRVERHAKVVETVQRVEDVKTDDVLAWLIGDLAAWEVHLLGLRLGNARKEIVVRAPCLV